MNQDVFRIAQNGDTLVITPTTDLRELEFDQMEGGAESVLTLLSEGAVRHVVIDLHETDYYGSTALSFFVKLHKRVKAAGGQMAFCGMSAHEEEILRLTHLDSLWHLCPDLGSAITAVHTEDPFHPRSLPMS